jgi:hypothetical protein
VTALASLSDLSARTSITIADGDVRALALLDDASAAVRAYTGQDFTQATTTARLRMRGGVVRLPQRPVTDVTAVQDVNGNDVAYTWDSGDAVYISGGGVVVPFDVEPFRTTQATFLDVTYEHGYATVPDDIVAVVCQIAGRAYGRAVEDSGMTQESITNYSYSVGAAAAAGGLGMLNDEKAVLDRYRIPVLSGRFAGT